METITYTNPEKAYGLMNQWTRMKTSYKIQFQGKKVTKIDIQFKRDQPRFASVHYKTDTSRGIAYIDLSKKILLDKPEKNSLDNILSTRK